MAVFAEGKTALNLNDCVFERREDLVALKRRLGKVDVLLLQLSYANWVGNSDDRASHERNAQRKRVEVQLQLQIVDPVIFIPFASFVYFSHPENFFMNAAVNRVSSIYKFTTERLGVSTVVLYSGERREVGKQKDSAESLCRYERDFERALSSPP